MEYKIDKRAVRERVTLGMESLSEEVKLNWNLYKVYKKELPCEDQRKNILGREELSSCGGNELHMFEELKEGKVGLYLLDYEDSIRWGWK